MKTNRKPNHNVLAPGIARFSMACVEAAGVPREDARIMTDALVQADLRGVESHGMMRLPIYVHGFQTRLINPQPKVKTVTDTAAVALLDGDEGLGLVVAHAAMSLAIRKAAEYGTATVLMRNSSHTGMAAYWAMMALEHDMIGYNATNASPIMAPWGGLTPLMGNNPIAYAIPGGAMPLVLDMALSVAARGKVRLSAMKGEPIPEGWATDKNGNPTTDARAALDGMMLPIAGYKGYGLSLVIDVLTGVLAGGLFGVDRPKVVPDGMAPPGYSHLFWTLDIAHFMPVAEFKQRLDRQIEQVRSSKPAPGVKRVLIPGERSLENRQRRLKEGIPYPAETVERLEELGRELGISPGW